MTSFISGKYCVPPDVLSAADNHLVGGDSYNVIGWVRQRLLREWRSWREFLREGRKRFISTLHPENGHVGLWACRCNDTTPTHTSKAEDDWKRSI